MQQYMVIFDVPDLTQEMMELVPHQIEVTERLFAQQRLFSYTLSDDYSTLWATFIAENSDDLLELVHSLPMTEYMTFEVQRLAFNRHPQPHMMSLSLN